VCSSIADGLDGLLPHLHARDLALVFVSRAPLAKLQVCEQRMGWSIPWVSSENRDFSFDVGASLAEDQARRDERPEHEFSPTARQLAAASGTDVLQKSPPLWPSSARTATCTRHTRPRFEVWSSCWS
jgi:predicted dithiol-disulfide oxidoreductase (DUF899 family)